MAELGALSLRIEAIGDKAVLSALNAIESKAKVVDKSVTDSVAALKQLGIAAKASGNQVSVAAADMETASRALQKMGLTATVVSKEQIAASRAEAAANRVRSSGFQKYLTLLTTGAQIETARADAIRQLVSLEAALQKQLQQTNLTFAQRVKVGEALSRVQLGIASGIEQTTQVTQRSAAAQAAQTQSVTLFGKAVVDTSGKVTGFGRSGLNAFNALAFGASQMAASGQASFRSLAASTASVLSFFGPKGAIAAGVIATGLVFADFFARTKKGAKETAAELQKLVQAGNARFAQQQPVQVAQRTADQQQAEVDRLQAEIDKKTAQIAKPGAGLAAAALIGERTELETQLATASFALTEAQRRLADAYTEAGKAAGEARDEEVTALTSTLDAGKATRAERQRANIILAQSRFALEALSQANQQDAQTAIQRAAVLDRIQKLEKALNAGRDVARKAIAEEINQLATLSQTRGLTGVEVVRLATLERQLAQELRDTRPDKEREAEIWEQITKARQAAARALPQTTVRPITDAANRRSAADASSQLTKPQPIAPGQLTIPDNVAAQLDPARIQADIQRTDAEMAARVAAFNFHETHEALTQSLGNALASAIATGFANGLGQGGIGEGFKQMAAQLSQGLGSVAIDYGLKAVAASKLMAGISKFLIANPVLAIGLGIGLVALGRAIGGSGGGGSTGSGFGGGSGLSAAGSLSAARLIVDPNAGARQRVATSLGSNGIASQAPDPFAGMQFLVVNTPSGRQFLSKQVAQDGARSG